MNRVALLALALALAGMAGCFKSEQAIRSSIMQEDAIKHSITQKTEYVDLLLRRIEDLLVSDIKGRHLRALATVVKPDGTVNFGTVQGLNGQLALDLRTITENLAEARKQWAGCLVDDANALVLNKSLQEWLKTKIQTSKMTEAGINQALALIEKFLLPAGKATTVEVKP